MLRAILLVALLAWIGTVVREYFPPLDLDDPLAWQAACDSDLTLDECLSALDSQDDQP